MYTYIAKDTQGNWFLSKWTFGNRKAAEEEAAEIAEYEFITEVRVVKTDSEELKNIKTYIN